MICVYYEMRPVMVTTLGRGPVIFQCHELLAWDGVDVAQPPGRNLNQIPGDFPTSGG